MFCPQVNKHISEDDFDCGAYEKVNKKAKVANQNQHEDEDLNFDKLPRDSFDNNNIENNSNQHDLKVSDSIAERIENDGVITEDRLTCYDNYWIERLANLDKSHTEEKLNLNEAQTIVNKLASYTFKISDPCEVDAMKLAHCHAVFEGQHIRCNEYVNNFIKCVDKSLQDVIKDKSEEKTEKNMTYTERFERGF